MKKIIFDSSGEIVKNTAKILLQKGTMVVLGAKIQKDLNGGVLSERN